MKFGENLKLIRKSKKISQEELAEKLGVARQSVSKWETGENYPSMQNIMCLCTIFKCKINELVHEDFADINFLDEEIKMSVVKFKKEEQKKMKGISKFICIISKIGNIAAKICLVTSILLFFIGTIAMANTNVNTKDQTLKIFKENYSYQLEDGEMILSSNDKITGKFAIAKGEEQTINEFLEFSKARKVTFVAIMFLSLTIIMLIIVKITNYIEKLFRNINENDTPFDMDNVYYIRKTAIGIFLYLLSQDVLGGITQAIYSLELNIDVDLSSYILALIILAISYVFKYGYEIQLDSKGKMYGEVNE